MKKKFLIKKIISACIILFLSIWIKPCFAGNEEYSFVKSYVKSLRLLIINAEKAENLKTGNPSDIAAMTTLLSECRQGIYRLEQAKSLIKEYLNLKNILIKEAANNIISVYDTKIALGYEQLKLFENMISKSEEFNEGKFIIESGKQDADNELSWDMLNNCSILITYCLVDQKPDKDGNLSYLVLTSNEREELIKELDNIFGESIKNGLKTGQTKLQVCGSIIKQFLVGEHRSADERK